MPSTVLPGAIRAKHSIRYPSGSNSNVYMCTYRQVCVYIYIYIYTEGQNKQSYITLVKKQQVNCIKKINMST